MRWHCCGPLAAGLICLSIGGCGLSNPEIGEIWDARIPATKDFQSLSSTAQIELEIRKRVYCELRRAVLHVQGIPVDEAEQEGGTYRRERIGFIPPGWVAKVSLSLQVDEMSAVNPGVTFTELYANAVKVFGVGNTVTTPQSFSLGFGGTLSSTATRIDKFNPAWTIGYLGSESEKGSCFDGSNHPWDEIHRTPARSSPFLLESDLGIEDWLMGATFIDALLPSDPSLIRVSDPASIPGIPAKKAPKHAADPKRAFAQAPPGGGGGGGGQVSADTISYEIKFLIVSSGNITPTWKLLRVSANSGATPFFQAGRTRTHDLTITIGPNDGETATLATVNSLQQAFSSAIRTNAQ